VPEARLADRARAFRTQVLGLLEHLGGDLTRGADRRKPRHLPRHRGEPRLHLRRQPRFELRAFFGDVPVRVGDHHGPEPLRIERGHPLQKVRHSPAEVQVRRLAEPAREAGEVLRGPRLGERAPLAA
jgi:hypothetical protein